LAAQAARHIARHRTEGREKTQLENDYGENEPLKRELDQSSPFGYTDKSCFLRQDRETPNDLRK
jgi:hypothetical protein